MRKLDLFEIVSLINKFGLDNSEWSTCDFSHDVDTREFFGTDSRFTLLPGKYIVAYVELDDKKIPPTYASESKEYECTIRFYLVG
jgi:hypothetical protein